tara:strand:- start:3775 stop:5880 length:2106 start_codon:yes stop_codon:yes gene_type:complete
MGFLSSLFGSSKSKPSVQQVVQSQKLPAEIAPAVKRVVDEAEAIYDAEKARGYVPYEGATIAPFTAQEEAAMQGIAGLVGTQQPFIDESLGLTRAQTEQFTPEVAQQFMSPYQRAVTDIEKREAQRVFEREVIPRLEAKAVEAGGMSGLGTRAALEAAEAQRNQAQLLSDIEARGLQAAFQDARSAFEQQKAREAGAAAAIGRAGAETFKSGLAEQGALQAVGEQRRDLAQSALDEEYFKFLEEREFPQQRLAEYSGFVYGNPLTRLPTVTESGTKTPFQPSFGRQLLGIGATLGGSFLGGPGGATIAKNIFGKTGGGLSDLIKRKEGGGFPDLSGDGKVTQKDILMGRGVISRQGGGQTSPDVGKEYSIFGSLYEALPDLKADERAAERKRLADLAEGSPYSLSSIVDRAYKAAVGDTEGLDRVRQEQFEKAQKLRSNLTPKTAMPKEMEVDVQQVSGGLSIPKKKTPEEIAQEKADEYRKYGLRTPEEIKKIAEDRAQRRLDAIAKDDTSFGRQALADFLLSIGTAAAREEGNVAEAFAERTKKTLAKQDETKKLTKKQELANLEAEFKAEDEAFGLPAKLIEKKNNILKSNLTVAEKVAKIKKLYAEAIAARRGKGKRVAIAGEKKDQIKNASNIIKFYAERDLGEVYSDAIDDLDSGPKEALVQSYLDFREKFKNVDNGDQLAALNAIKEVIRNLNK